MWWALGMGLLGVMAYLWERGNRADVESAKAYVEKNYELMRAQAIDLRKQLGMEQERGNRNELAINLLRGDLGRLNDELEKCAVPGAIRDRLSRLLAAPNRKPDGRV